MAVVLDHAVGINSEAGFSGGLFLEVRKNVHAGGVPPKEEGFVLFCGTLHEVEGLLVHFLVNGLHTLLGERSGVLDATVGKAVYDAAGAEFLFEIGVLRVVGILGFLLGVEVVEISKKLVEAVVGREHVVAVAEVVFSELAGDIALRLKQRRDGGVFFFHPLGSTGEADFREASADGRLAGDEGGAAGGAGLLAIPIGKIRALAGDAVDVRSAVAHHAAVDRADVELADVVAPDDEDVWFFIGRLGCKRGEDRQGGEE